MTTADDRQEEAEAISWIIRLRGADAATWETFTTWLEQSPARLAAYDRVTMAGSDLPQASREVPTGLPIRRWRGGARMLVASMVAAMLLVIAGRSLLALRGDGTDSYRIATPIGAQRSVALADGTRIALAGGTQLLLTHGDVRRARLISGSARFRVVHNPARPFEVALGTVRVRDAGTDFVLTRVGDRSEVAVINGAVLYDPGGAGLRLATGDRIVDPDGPAPIEQSRAEPASIGGWADGHLFFRQASMEAVAHELSRATGLTVTVDPTLSRRRFTGRITLGGDTLALQRRVAALLDVKVRSEAHGWQLASVG